MIISSFPKTLFWTGIHFIYFFLCQFLREKYFRNNLRKIWNTKGRYIVFLLVSLLRELKWHIMDLSKCLQKERGHSVLTAKHLITMNWNNDIFVSQIPLCLQTAQMNVIRTSRTYFFKVWRLSHLLHSHMLIWKKNIYIYIHLYIHSWTRYHMGSILKSKTYRCQPAQRP